MRREGVGPIPFGALGMIPLLILIECFVARQSLDVTSAATYSWKLSESATGREACGAEILCMGDSLVKHGLLPRVLEEGTGRRAFNLATSAAQAPSTFYLLDHALKRGARPRSLIVDFSPDLLIGPPRSLIRNYPEILNVRELIELARVSRDYPFATETLVARAFPSINSRFEIRSLIRGWAEDARDPSPRPATLMHARNWQLHGGAQFTPGHPTYQGQVTNEDVERLCASRFWCHKTNRSYLDRLFKLAAKHGIQVHWLLPPVVPALQSVRDESGSDAKHEAFIRSMQETNLTLRVIDARRAGFAASEFVDPIHLTGRGALALSRQVAEVIATEDGEHWARLAGALDFTGADRFEDLHRSRLAIESGSDGTLRR